MGVGDGGPRGLEREHGICKYTLESCPQDSSLQQDLESLCNSVTFKIPNLRSHPLRPHSAQAVLTGSSFLAVATSVGFVFCVLPPTQACIS